MYNIFQKQIYIKHYNIIRASHGQLTSFLNCSLLLCQDINWFLCKLNMNSCHLFNDKRILKLIRTHHHIEIKL